LQVRVLSPLLAWLGGFPVLERVCGLSPAPHRTLVNTAEEVEAADEGRMPLRRYSALKDVNNVDNCEALEGGRDTAA
jgi:hypothetical protein